MTTLELTAKDSLKSVLRRRGWQFVITASLLAILVFTIIAGWLGTPVGSSNISIVMVWIAWWAALILVAVPLAGRSWCAICPLPLPGEWLQRGAILGPPERKPTRLGLRWPKRLRGIWLQIAAFLMLALFSSILLTSPKVTAVLLAAMLLAAVTLSMLFERRAFCRYICPVGGFIGLYAQASPLELRVRDKTLCAVCKSKACYNGSESGYGCPWGVFPGGLTRNTYCGLCLECLRTCPRDNIAIRLRFPAADLAHPSSRLDEAFKAFIMLGAALTYSAVLLGPWSQLKDAAYQLGSRGWFAYAAVFLIVTCLALPGLFALSAIRSTKRTAFRHRFARLATALIPLGLTAWFAFSLGFVLNNASYVWAAISDPLALGWNLFGTANTPWQPVLVSWLTPAQTLALVVGFLWSARTARTVAGLEQVASTPIIAYCLVFTLAILWLLV